MAQTIPKDKLDTMNNMNKAGNSKFQAKRPVKIAPSTPTAVKNAGEKINKLRKNHNYRHIPT